MPDKKLTDSEIVKALECCTQGRDIKVCWDCPLYVDLETARECCEKLNTNALDLINRLQAENEQLKREIESLESIQEISPEAKHFVDTKANKVISLLNEVIKSQDQIKAEAYKEFAERLKSEYADFDKKYEVILPENLNKAIDDLLKEKVGVDNA